MLRSAFLRVEPIEEVETFGKIRIVNCLVLSAAVGSVRPTARVYANERPCRWTDGYGLLKLMACGQLLVLTFSS